MQALWIERGDRHAAITLRGELDLATSCDELLAQLPALNNVTSGRIAVDLSGVIFLDCGGLRVLLTLEQRIHRQGGRLCLAEASPAVTRVFELLAAYLEPCDLFKPCLRDRTVVTAVGPPPTAR